MNITDIFKNCVAAMKFAVNHGDFVDGGSKPILFATLHNHVRGQFELLGFKFHETSIQNTLEVVLPKGWRVLHLSGNRVLKHFHILKDDKNRSRCLYEYKISLLYGPVGCALLNGRYGIDTDIIKKDGKNCVKSMYICDLGNPNNEKLYELGEYSNEGSEKTELELKGLAYLRENYPDWKNPLNYWD